MIRLTTISIYILLGWGLGFAQLLPRTLSLTFPDGGRISGTEVPVVRQDQRAASLISVSITFPINRQGAYCAEVTNIERFNDSGVAFISRSNHWLVYQSLRFELNKKLIPSVKSALTLSSYSFVDNKSLKPVSQHWEVSSNLIFKNKSEIQIQFQHRHDQLKLPFTLGTLQIRSNQVSYQSASLRFSAKPGNRSRPFIEARFGYYYEHYGFYSVRLGEIITLSPRLTGYLDGEFSRVRGDVFTQGIVTRLQMDYQINKAFRTGFYILNNTYDRFNGLRFYIGVSKNYHSIRLEYREKRIQFHFTESTHSFFASHILIQYRYFIPDIKGCKK